MGNTGQRSGICVVGSANVDTTLALSTLPTPGETCLSSGKRVSQGGKGANQAAAAAAMGSKVAFVGATGDDAEGSAVRANLSGRGIDISAVEVVAGCPTGSAVVLVAADGENVIVVDPAANGRVSAESVRRSMKRQSAAVVLAQLEIPLDAVLAAAQEKGDALFVLNPAPMPPPSATLSAILSCTDVLVPNRNELAQIVGRPTPAGLDELDACASELAFDGVLVVTLGGDGAVVYTDCGRTRSAVVAPASVTVVDTSGAGDAFCGVLAHYLGLGTDAAEAVRLANELAALSTTYHGAQVPPTFSPPVSPARG